MGTSQKVHHLSLSLPCARAPRRTALCLSVSKHYTVCSHDENTQHVLSRTALSVVGTLRGPKHCPCMPGHVSACTVLPCTMSMPIAQFCNSLICSACGERTSAAQDGTSHASMACSMSRATYIDHCAAITGTALPRGTAPAQQGAHQVVDDLRGTAPAQQGAHQGGRRPMG